MKFGLLVEQDTRNIGDDVQAFAAKRFLPRIDYFVDRNHIDEFVPDSNELVATITNGWFLQYTLNWPPSPYIKPLPISMHFTSKDWFWDTTDRAYHLQGYGLDYLKKIEPIGCRDSHTLKLLTEKGVKTEYTGCMTLTLKRFDDVTPQNYICAVDVSEKVVEKIRQTTDMEVKVITHTVPEDYYTLPWEERFKRVEELLRTYQGAKAVVTYRLHCALPCLALGTPVILLNEDYRNDRFGDYTKYIESCSEEAFLSDEVKYDYNNIPKHSTEWMNLRDDLINRCEKFVQECENNDEIISNDVIDVAKYKEYVVAKSNWLKEATNESYKRFEDARNRIEEEVKKHEEDIKNANTIINELKAEKDFYHKEFDECVSKMEAYRDELERIKSSKLWKIRTKIKGDTSNG